MIKKILLSLILSFMCLVSFQNVVYADTGKIEITYEIENDDGKGNRTTVPVQGASFKYFKVWSLSDDQKTITFDPPFDAIGINPDDLFSMNSDEIQKLSDDFEALIDDSYILGSVTTDAQGKIVIDGVDKGAYLFVQEKPVIIDKQYYMANTFLVTVPYEYATNLFTSSVSIKPKGTIIKSPEIVKYVNDTDLYGLKYRDEVFTYSICTFIPTVGVNNLNIYDVLEEVLEFAPELNLKITVDEGADAFVIDDPIGNGFVTVDETSRTITLTLDNAYMAANRGKAIRIDFDAKIKAGASLNRYTQRRVPNKACYVIDRFIANKISYDSFMAASKLFNNPMMIVGPLRLDDPVFEMCSEEVFVYVPEKPIIPVTGIMIMEALEKNPWIILVVAAIIVVVVRKAMNNNKYT